MTDRELLELAAKAAGYELKAAWEYEDGSSWYGVIARGEGFGEDFDPLNDDGDALRLAVKLNISIHQHRKGLNRVFATSDGGRGDACTRRDPEAATRRAIVRAAAEIGRAM